MTVSIFHLAFFILFIYVSWKDTKWGVFLITALLPAYLIRFSVFNVPLTLLEGMIWLIFIVWFIKLKKEKNLTLNPLNILKNIKNKKLDDKKNPIPHAFRLPITLFLIASTFSVFISPSFDAAAGIWKAYFAEALMFFIVFIYTIKSTGDLKKIFRFLGLTVIVIGIFAIIQKFTGALIPNPFWANETTRRVTTFFGYPNANALFILPIIFLTIGNLLTDKRIKFIIFNLVVIALGALTIAWTNSTGALLALVVGLIFLLIFYKKTRIATLLFILVIIVSAFFTPLVTEKLQNIIASTNEIHLPQNPSDLQIRAQMWRETFSMIKDAPIFGSGLNGYQTLVKPYHVNQHLEIFLYPHNFFLNFWSETGLLGLVSIIWILIIFFIITLKSKANILNFSLTSAMIALLVYGLVDVPYFKNDLSILFWILIASSILLYNERRCAGVPPRAGRG